jgi:hypothetical protein
VTERVEVETPINVRGVWIAYREDWSQFLLFKNETDCLRHAVNNSMRVMACPFRRDPREVLRDGPKKRPAKPEGGSPEPEGGQ